jgi:hypothetical protein
VNLRARRETAGVGGNRHRQDTPTDAHKDHDAPPCSRIQDWMILRACLPVVKMRVNAGRGRTRY